MRLGLVRFLQILVLVILPIAVTAGGQRASAQIQDKTETIRGTVFNSVTHAPIPRALVSSPDNRFATMTNDEGQFEFTFPRASEGADNEPGITPNRPTILLARKPGFLAEREFNAIDLSSNRTDKDLTLSLVPEATLVGRVTLPSSEPPDTIFLQAYRHQVMDGMARWVPAGGTQSRSDGEFRFAELPAGTYKVLTRELLDRDPLTFDPQGQLYGYPPAYFQNAPDFASASTIELAAGATVTANLSLTRLPYYRVHLPVANVAPDTGLNINVFAAGRRGPGFSLGYNNRDQTIEGMLPNGTYTVEAFSFGERAVTGMLTITVHGNAVQGPSVVLVPNASINVDVKEEFSSDDRSGTITFDDRGRSITLRGPRRYLNVMLEPADDAEGGVASLRAPTKPGDESLVVENARPGRYWVRVMSSRGYVASVRSGNIDLQHQPLVVGGGGATSPIEITMRDDTGQIEGTVEGITPAPPVVSSYTDIGSLASRSSFVATGPAPAHIYCIPLPDSSGQVTEVAVSPDGSFTSPPLPPGAYRLLAFDRQQSELEYRNPEAMQSYDTKGPVVRLASGQTEHVRLQLISTNE